jgi:hypothetical protein
MLEGLLWTVLGVMMFALAMLAVPIDIMARFDLSARPRGSLRIGWLFGLVRLRTDIGDRTPTVSRKPRNRKEKRRRRRPNLALVRRGFGLLGDLLRQVRIERVELDLSVGTDDPATTGEIVGYAAPVVALANALPRTRVALTPDFTGPTVGGVGAGEIRLVPVRLVPPIFRFAFSPEVRQWVLARR